MPVPPVGACVCLALISLDQNMSRIAGRRTRFTHCVNGAHNVLKVSKPQNMVGGQTIVTLINS